jgi:hypothetical protein
MAAKGGGQYGERERRADDCVRRVSGNGDSESPGVEDERWIGRA